MKKMSLIVLASLTGLYSFGQGNNPNFDKVVADSLGGDDYGMKFYVLVILKPGPKTFEKKISDSLFIGHINNIVRLAAIKKLVLSGPLKKNEKSYAGIFILNVKTILEADALLSTDPAVHEGLLAAELYQWYGSAALPEYLKVHDKIQKKNL
jgi:uncharacterized protein YciI